jgi:Mrp family chromosome partitioning ATPase
MDDWSRHFDVVLFDTAAAGTAADARIVAAKAEGAFVITKINKSKYGQVRALSEELTGIGVSVVGSVINK